MSYSSPGRLTFEIWPPNLSSIALTIGSSSNRARNSEPRFDERSTGLKFNTDAQRLTYHLVQHCAQSLHRIARLQHFRERAALGGEKQSKLAAFDFPARGVLHHRPQKFLSLQRGFDRFHLRGRQPVCRIFRGTRDDARRRCRNRRRRCGSRRRELDSGVPVRAGGGGRSSSCRMIGSCACVVAQQRWMLPPQT